jgi:NADH:ubiquinone oxidoreductase subunit D
MLRGSGINYDMRKNNPYEIYNQIDFLVPTAANGDCLSRYFVRVSEMKESLKIIMQAINKMPIGTTKTHNSKVSIQKRHFTKYQMEATINHFKNVAPTRAVTFNFQESYASVEAPKGEFGVYLALNDSDRVLRARIKAPGFIHLQGINFMSCKHLIADVVTNIGTQDIVFGEVDR